MREITTPGVWFGDAAEARKMLSFLSGRTHRVLTGLCVLRVPEGAVRSAVENTSVTFAPVTQKEIADYVASLEPFDKATTEAKEADTKALLEAIPGGPR